MITFTIKKCYRMCERSYKLPGINAHVLGCSAQCGNASH